MIVKLSRQEESQCKQASRMRWQMNRASGIEQQRKAPQDAGDIDLLGIRAECAVAKALSLDFNPYHLGIDSGADLFAGNISIDVKARFNGSNTLFGRPEKFRADVVVSCEQVKDGIGIVGWASKQRFLERAQVRDLGHGETMALPDSELTDISVLWREITARRVNGGT
jgi:hypothetical protein